MTVILKLILGSLVHYDGSSLAWIFLYPICSNNLVNGDVLYFVDTLTLPLTHVMIAKTLAGHTLFVVVGIFACYELFWSWFTLHISQDIIRLTPAGHAHSIVVAGMHAMHFSMNLPSWCTLHVSRIFGKNCTCLITRHVHLQDTHIVFQILHNNCLCIL